MSIKKDFEEASKQFHDYLNIFVNKFGKDAKDKSPAKIYDDIEPIGDKEWGMLKSNIYSRRNNIGLALLPKFKSNYLAGYYPSKKEFLEKVDRLYENLQKCDDALKSQSETDNEIFDDLFEEYNGILNQRTMDNGVADRLLKGKAREIQKKIETYLAKKVRTGETLTDEMLGFKGVDALEDDMYFEKVLKPQIGRQPTLQWHEPIDEVDSESYENHTLYVLAEDMEDEWAKNKNTKEFRCYQGKRIRFFEWCSHKYTYEGGKTFDAEGLQNSLNVAKSRAKSKKIKP